MEDDLKKNKNGRQPQQKMKWKTTSILRQSYWAYLTTKTSKRNGFDTIEIDLVFVIFSKDRQALLLKYLQHPIIELWFRSLCFLIDRKHFLGIYAQGSIHWFIKFFLSQPCPLPNILSWQAFSCCIYFYLTQFCKEIIFNQDSFSGGTFKIWVPTKESGWSALLSTTKNPFFEKDSVLIHCWTNL